MGRFYQSRFLVRGGDLSCEMSFGVVRPLKYFLGGGWGGGGIGIRRSVEFL